MIMEVLVEEFQNLKIMTPKQDDPRTDINILHPVENIIVISTAAIIAGAEGPTSIARWAEDKKDWLATWLQLPQGKKAESRSACSSSIRAKTASEMLPGIITSSLKYGVFIDQTSRTLWNARLISRFA